MKEIDIEEILKKDYENYIDFCWEPMKYNREKIAKIIKEVCNQVIDLCIENVTINWGPDGESIIIDKESILKTKEQII